MELSKQPSNHPSRWSEQNTDGCPGPDAVQRPIAIWIFRLRTPKVIQDHPKPRTVKQACTCSIPKTKTGIWRKPNRTKNLGARRHHSCRSWPNPQPLWFHLTQPLFFPPGLSLVNLVASTQDCWFLVTSHLSHKMPNQGSASARNSSSYTTCAFGNSCAEIPPPRLVSS